MTAPGDVIGASQGLQPTGSIGHGADPDDFLGTERLDTGNRTDGTPNTGKLSHSRVFELGSDSWNSTYEFFTGGEAQGYRTPHFIESYRGNAGVRVQDGWNDDGGTVDIQ